MVRRGLVGSLLAVLAVAGLPLAPRAVISVLPVDDSYGALLAQSGALVAHWDFDEPYSDPDPDNDGDNLEVGEGRVLADSGNYGLDAQAYRAAITGQPGNFGNAISLGSHGIGKGSRWSWGAGLVGDDWANPQWESDLSLDEFTWEIWFRTTYDEDMCLMCQKNGVEIWLLADGDMRGKVNTSGNDPGGNGDVLAETSGQSYNDGTWHHAALTFEPGDGSSEPSEGVLYVDGVEVASDLGTLGGAVYPPGNGLYFGTRGDSGWTAGDLDEPAIYDGPLDPSIIGAHADQPIDGEAQPLDTWATGTYSQVVGSHGPVAQWKLDDPASSGTLADSSGNNNDATITSLGTVDFEQDAPFSMDGTAAEYNSAQATAGVDDKLTPFNEMSVEAWVKSPSGGTSPPEGAVYAWDNYGPRLYVHEDGYPYFRARGQSATLYTAVDHSVVLDDGGWHQLVGVITGESIVLYVDGVLVASTWMREWPLYRRDGLGNSAGALVGGEVTHAISAYRGLVDEVAVYDYALSPVEIWSHQDAAGSPTCGWYVSCEAAREASEAGVEPAALGIGAQEDEQPAGDPVTTVNGNFTHSVTDLASVAGKGGIEFTRTFNSKDRTETLLGQGWSTTADTATYPDPSDPDSRRVVRMPNGARHVFKWDGTSQWLSPDGVQAALTETATGWDLDFVSGELWTFDGAGRLESMVAVDGTQIDVTWPGSGVVAKFSNAETGWFAELHDDANGGPVDRLTEGDCQAVCRTVDYAWSGTELVSVSQPSTGAVKTAESYEYTDGLVTRVKDALGGLVIENQYLTSLTGIVDSQTTSTGQIVDFDYTVATGTEAYLDTVVTYDDGGADPEEFTYRHTTAGALMKVTDSTGEAVDKAYDARQLESFTNRKGELWSRDHDGEGRLDQATSPSPGGTSYIAYVGAGDPRPWITIAADGHTTTYEYATSDPADTVPSKVWECELQEDPGNGVGSADACDPQDPSIPSPTQIQSSDGLVTQVTDPDGIVTAYSYTDTTGCTERQLCSQTVGGVTKSFTYDAATGQVATITTPDGTTVNEYDDWGRLERTFDPIAWADYGPDSDFDETHYATSYGYFDDGAAAWISDPANPDTDGPDGGQGDGLSPSVQYSYWGGSWSGSPEVWTPDTDASSVPQPAGELKDEITLIEEGTTPVTSTTRTRYTASGWVASVTEALGTSDEATTTNTYGRLGRLLRTDDPSGIQTHFCYDEDGNQTKRAVGTPASGTIDCTTPQSSLAVWTTGYNALGQVTSEVDPDGVTTTYTYDEAGRVETEVRAPGDGEESNTTYFYDALGRLSQVKADRGVSGDPERPFSHDVVEGRRYSDAGRLEVILRPPQDSLTFTWPQDPLADSSILKEYIGYDSAGRELCRVHPAGTPSFDGNGDLDCDASTGAVRYGYDTAGRLECELDPGDSDSWVTSNEEIDCGGSIGATRYDYDPLGRRTRTYRPDPSATDPSATDEVSQIVGYTPTGQVASETDFAVDPTQGGTPTRTFTYYDSGTLKAATDAAGTTVEYSYDLRGNRTQRRSTTTAGGSPTSCGGSSVPTCVLENWTYDLADRVLSHIDGEGRTANYEYDYDGEAPASTIEAGRLWRGTDAEGYSQTHTRTPAGRVTKTHYDDGTNSFDVDFTYDNLGRRFTMDDETVGAGQGPTQYLYDSAGNLMSMTLPDDDVVEWMWDLNGATRQRITTLGVKLRFTHDRNYNLYKSEFYADPYWFNNATYTYDAAGREIHETIGWTGAYRDWDRTNPAGSVEEYDQLVSGVDLTTALAWQPDGRLTQEDTDGECLDYTYDTSGQLDLVQADSSSCASPSTVADYDYDGHGRRSSESADDYAYDLADQLLGIGDGCALDVNGDPDANCDRTFTYDDAGRRLTAYGPDIDTDYTWSPDGHLSRLEQDNGAATVDISFTRDGDGHLTKAGTGTLVWDPTMAVPEAIESDNDSDGDTDVSYSYGRRRIQQGNGHVFAYDHLDSNIRRLWGGSLPTLEPTSYGPFGEPDTDNNWPIYFGYRGEYQIGLPEQTIVHLRNRDYDPTTGTFLTPDPLLEGPNSPELGTGLGIFDGETTVANPYNYVSNDPLNLTDPLGLCPTDCELRQQPAINLRPGDRLGIIDSFGGLSDPAQMSTGARPELGGLVVFTQWEIESRRVVAGRGGSAWWRAVNGSMMLDIQEANQLISRGGAGASSQNPRVQAWIDYHGSLSGSDGAREAFWRAHQLSLHWAIDCYGDLLDLEDEFEREFIDGVVENVDLTALVSMFEGDSFAGSLMGSATLMNAFVAGPDGIASWLLDYSGVYPDYGDVNAGNAFVSLPREFLGNDYIALAGLLGLGSGRYWARL